MILEEGEYKNTIVGTLGMLFIYCKEFKWNNV